MEVPFKFWITFIVTFTFSVVNSPPTIRDLDIPKTRLVAVLEADANLGRKRRELVVGHGCPQGKIWYFTRCKFPEQIDYDDTSSVTETDTLYTSKVTLQDKKHMETMDFDENLSVMGIEKLESIVTEQNLNEKQSKIKTKSRFSDTEPNPFLTKQQLEVIALKPVVTHLRPTMKNQNKFGIDLTFTRTESTPITAVTTATGAAPVRVEPHTVTQLKTKPNNVAKIPYTEAEPRSSETKLFPAVAKLITIPTQFFVTDPKRAVSEAASTPAIAELIHNVTESASTMLSLKPAATDTQTITKEPTLTVAEVTQVRSKTSLTSAPKTISLPTETSFTNSESTYSTTGVQREDDISLFLNLEPWIYKSLIVIIFSCVIILKCLYKLLYKKPTGADYGEKAVEMKTIQ